MDAEISNGRMYIEKKTNAFYLQYQSHDTLFRALAKISLR